MSHEMLTQACRIRSDRIHVQALQEILLKNDWSMPNQTYKNNERQNWKKETTKGEVRNRPQRPTLHNPQAIDKKD